MKWRQTATRGATRLRKTYQRRGSAQAPTIINIEVAHDTDEVHQEMAKTETEKSRIRRAYSAAGERSQKMMSFRLDNEVAEWLSSKVNKGRYINDLIRTDMEKEKGLPP